MVATFNRAGDKILTGDSKGFVTVINSKTFEVTHPPFLCTPR
jgi:hypothetical protein